MPEADPLVAGAKKNAPCYVPALNTLVAYGSVITGLIVMPAYFAVSKDYGSREIALILAGFTFGFFLYNSGFGYTGAFRFLLVRRRGQRVRAITILIFFGSIIAWILHLTKFKALVNKGASFELEVSPASNSVILGSYLFGVGMSLASGCASGCLYESGGGNVRSIVVFIFFVIGTVIAATDKIFSLWSQSYKYAKFSLFDEGWWGFAQPAFLAAAYYFTIYIEKKKYGNVDESFLNPSEAREVVSDNEDPLLGTPKTRSFFFKGEGVRPSLRSFITGGNGQGYSYYFGAIGILIAFLISWLGAGEMVGVMGVFPIWFAKVFGGVIDFSKWKYFNEYSSLPDLFFKPSATNTDFGLVLGAAAASSLAKKFGTDNIFCKKQTTERPLKSYIAAIIGGLLLGIGSRLSYGCNIGSLTTGMISGSIHSYLWLLFNMLGIATGVLFRPFFTMEK